MKRNRIVKVVAAVGMGLLLLLGFQIVVGTGVATLMRESWPTQTSLEARFQAVQIQVEDLPSGWHEGSVRVEDVPEAEARFYSFYGTSDPNKTWVKVSQKLILYPDSEAAANAYDGWVTKYIPPAHKDAWILPPGLEFTGQADQMVVACHSGYINNMHHYACEAIGRYEDTVVVLQGNVFDDRWLKMEDFQAVLEAMDRRIVAAAEGAEQ